MNLFRFSFLILLPSVSAGRGFVSRPKALALVNNVPRGGGCGPLSSDVASKVYLATFGLNAAHCLIAPRQNAEIYGNKPNEFDAFLIRGIGGIGTNVALLFYLQTMKNLSFEKAMSWSPLPFVAQEVFKLLTDQHEAVGMKRSFSIFTITLNLLVSFAGHTEASYGPTVFKVYAGFSLLNAIPHMLQPATAGTASGLIPKTAFGKFLMAMVGNFLLSHALAVGLQVFGVTSSTTVAMGWCALTMTGSLVLLCVQGLVTKAGMSNIPILVWAGLLAVLGSSLIS